MADPPTDTNQAQQPASSNPPNITRESSPTRNSRNASGIPQLARSRKNSQEFSPTRNPGGASAVQTIPSAAAVQRALSAQRPLNPPTTVDGVLEGSRGDRTVRSGHNSPSWPTSPRLKSPPPSGSGNRPSTSRRNENEQTPSNTSIKRLAPVSTPDLGAAMHATEAPKDASKDLTASQSTARGAGRGASTQTSGLETVAEGSVPTSPSLGPILTPSTESNADVASLDRPSETSPESSTILKEEEGSGDGAAKPGTEKMETTEKERSARASSSTRPAANLAKRSYTSLTTAKNKGNAESARTMTVETEPVTSMPQLLGGDRGVSGRDGSGTVKTKPSNETIRPKKEKRKSTRKPPSLHTGTVTSKADIFEAKVANAVDEADSSDSDETFVYESNPPDARPSRHHSRTPSATSHASQEQHALRNKHGVRSGSHAIAGKKSMKFSNSGYSNHLDGEAGADGRSSVRTTSSTPRHHLIGRYGRAGHASILDTDSPFTQANRSNSPRNLSGNGGHHSRPNSPRIGNGRLQNSPRKGDPSTFDAYEEGAADDERTPLVGSVRINRTRHSRRPTGGSYRQGNSYADVSSRSFCGRWGGCVILGLVVVMICLGVAAFVVALNQSLQGVRIKHIQNILASEQEIMLDLHVEAINPNLFAITVTDLDVYVFAESPYVGSAKQWRQHHSQLRWIERRRQISVEWERFPYPSTPFRPHNGIDEGTDPIDDPESGTQKMLLGRIFDFDSPLVFDPSPIRRIYSSSVGEIKLARPGNKTEEGGSARWEKVLKHPFDLIVRGVIQYQLPLSSKTRSAKIVSRAKVLPNQDDVDEMTDQ